MFLADSDISRDLGEWRESFPSELTPMEKVREKVISTVERRREDWSKSTPPEERAKGPAGAVLVFPFPSGVENKENRPRVPGSEAGVIGAACHLRLGDEVFLASEETPRKLRDVSPFLSIAPGELAVLMSDEYVYLPDHIIGFISVRNTYKQKGIVSVSGFHVDPGFHGRLTFTVYNAGPNSVPLRFRDQMFIITFAELNRPTRPYGGSFIGQIKISQAAITSLQGPSLSPRNLDERLRRLEIEVRILLAPLAAAIIAAILSFLKR